MLKTRVMTACVLLVGLLVGLLVLPYQAFVLLMSAVFLLAAGEWANMSGLVRRWQQIAYAVAMAFVMWLLFALGGHRAGILFSVVLVLSLLGWLCALVVVCRYPAVRIPASPSLLLLSGFWLLIPAWLGILFLQPLIMYSGMVWLVIAVVAFADIGAYFAGRRFGRHKLAVHVSPNKTWEGFWGGTCANAVLATCLAVILELDMWRAAGFVIAIVLVSCASVLGDLFESMIKREFGIKDSSQLLPGHGGVLDRIDGWTAAVPVFTLLYVFGGILS